MNSMKITDQHWHDVILYSSSVFQLHRTIKKILDLLLTQYQIEHKNATDKRIVTFIQERCSNYTENPKKMIDSLLERNKRFIVLNKLIYKDTNNEEQVTTDPNLIKQLTNNHF